MCEKTIKKSETTTKKYIDEWIDGEGKFHRKTIFETITGPMDLNQATFPFGRQNRKGLNFNTPKPGLQRLNHPRIYQKSFWGPMYPEMIKPGYDPLSRALNPDEIGEFIERKNKIMENMKTKTYKGPSEEKPAIDVKEFIEKGRKILSGMGIDVETEIKNLFTKPKEETKEEVNPDTTNSEEEPKQELKSKIQKEVKTKWQKTKKPLKKQNQKNQKKKK